MTLRMARCFFCATPPLGEYVVTSDAPVSLQARQGGTTRTRLVLPLCVTHHAVLQDSGARGRVHGPTRVRWWLGVR